MSTIKTDKAAKPKPPRSKRSGPEPRLKVAVRRLPPNLPETVFWESVAPWVDAQTTSWKVFHLGKLRPKGVNKENVLSRAYIQFNTEEQLKNFHRDYDGHLFRDKSGNESHAVVEYATFQKVPMAKGKVDQRQGTIEDDEDFKSFIASLSQVEPTEAEKLAMAPPPDISEKTTTPLLASLLPKEGQVGKAAEGRDKHQETRPENKSASGKSRKRKEKEQAQKERIDAAEFSRAPIVPLDTTRPAEEQSKKGQTAKERPENAKSPNQPYRKPSESADAPGKSKGKAPNSPVRSTKSKAPPSASQPSHDPAGPSTAGVDGSTSPHPQKARPKFKFDGILAPGGGRPRPSKSDSTNTVIATSSPTTETATSETTNPPPRKNRKGKERDSTAPSASAAKGGGAAESSASRPENMPAKPPVQIVPRILQRPARIDDDGAIPESPTAPGIIPIQLPPRGRGRGGGRGRGRGRGRGGAPAPES